MRNGLVVAFVPVVVTLVACGGARHYAPERDRNLITAEEIATVRVTTAYDVVARLRGEFLKTRGPVSATLGRAVQRPPVTVFIDGVEAGTVERTLHLIPSIDVVEIRLYRAGDAATKYGSRHSGGVIEVSTTRQGRP
jgi:hypothetical protein